METQLCLEQVLMVTPAAAEARTDLFVSMLLLQYIILFCYISKIYLYFTQNTSLYYVDMIVHTTTVCK